MLPRKLVLTSLLCIGLANATDTTSLRSRLEDLGHGSYFNLPSGSLCANDLQCKSECCSTDESETTKACATSELPCAERRKEILNKINEQIK